MRDETFRASAERTPATMDPAAKFCRSILAIDQIIEPALRAAYLSRSDFNMLLDIYVADLEGRCICMFEVCQAASVPFSTAHRHLSAMIDRGLVERRAARGDWRRVVVGLAADARGVIDTIAAGIRGRYEISRVEDVSSSSGMAGKPACGMKA
jgi:DNA-binding MarR family transcriptional regulator